MKKRYILLAVTLIVSITSAVTAFAADAKFKDTKVTDWYYPYMSKMVDKGAISGYPDKTFRPNKTMTNAEFITTIVAATVGKQDKTGQHWASGYFEAAKKNEMLIGDEMQQSDWNKPITRQKMAVVIARTTEKVLKEEPIANADKFKNEIKDYAGLCDYCKPYILQAYGKGIISGYPDGTFGGSKTATRAEVCSMLTRMLEPADRTTEKVVDKDKTGTIKDIITNSQDIFGGKHLTTYVISDPKLWNMELGEDEFSKHVIMKDPGLEFFVINGKAVDSFCSVKMRDGRFAIEYELLLHKENMQGRAPIDITKVDYIGSYDTVNPVLTLIPNPFKK
ncbi:S-layer homology domain-containing protein [Sinanaerobacter sp. ZZT-01]|uniref:S-layer homology domain-containing protein n=1 Tax=Sinanaerobacter sp. ZZT-01 TaxID=3111540 RepID=UPI002D7677F2|nr:S-layer homology domain-containing protein [Sinanaerobacter sp. ZZT-01]WRR94172.1 S-layer homology domain-containing protein [Sinanaerobacter sp. ZZT-01]